MRSTIASMLTPLHTPVPSFAWGNDGARRAKRVETHAEYSSIE
jgi:hypothetical protein